MIQTQVSNAVDLPQKSTLAIQQNER